MKDEWHDRSAMKDFDICPSVVNSLLVNADNKVAKRN